jgi:acyl-coenzyme A synthetase/AMP-(fatty) acid ligase
VKILDVLKNCTDDLLLVSKDKEISKKDFSILVNNYVICLSNMPTGEGFILVGEQDPISFYSLVFALWKSGKKVLFPNRDILSNALKFPYYEYTVRVLNGKPYWEKNNDYQALQNIKGDAIVFSSGSTGDPKGIVHSKESFLLNAKRTADIIGLGVGGTVTPLKPYLMSAFSHFLVHYLTNSYLCFIENDRLEELVDYYKSDPTLAFVGSPMHILSGRKYIPNSASPRMFISSGDFMHSNVIQNIIQDFPKSVYYYVYGIAELGGRFFINKINSDTSIEDYSCLGRSLFNMNISVRDGEIYVDTESKFLGYIKKGRFIGVTGYYPSGDLVDIHNNCLTLIGRKGEEVKVAGNKVSLKNLEKKSLRAFPDEVLVFISVQHEILGTLIAVVIQSLERYSRKEVLVRLRSVLEAYEIPHYIYIFDKFPYTQSAKIDRKQIKDRLSDSTLIK